MFFGITGILPLMKELSYNRSQGVGVVVGIDKVVIEGTITPGAFLLKGGDG